MVEELLAKLRECPYLADAAFPEAEGRQALISLEGGSARTLLDGSAQYRLRVRFEMCACAHEAAAWLMRCCPELISVSLPATRAGEQLTRYTFSAEFAIRG